MVRSVYKTVLLLLLMFFSVTAISQEDRKGIHQLQAEQYGNYDVSVVKKKSNEPIIPLQKEAQSEKALDKVVFGFLPDWEYTTADANMEYELLSHLAVFAFSVQNDGSLAQPGGWPWADVINNAHTAGTKVIMTITNFALSKAETHEVLISGAKREQLFAEITNVISANNLDGINVDFEGLHTDVSDRGSVMNNFLFELRAYLDAHFDKSELSFSTPPVNWGSAWKFDDMSEIVDHIFVMAYDYNENKGAIADAVSPLYPRNSYAYCIDRTFTVDYASVMSKHPEKLILGVPYYGQSWQTETADLNSTVIKHNWSTRYKDIDVFNSDYTRYWDDVTLTPWFFKPSDGEWRQVYMDDLESLTLKYDYAISKKLGGVGMWALNYDGEKRDLWNLIADKFSGGNLSNNELDSNSLKVYPNPVKNILYVEVDGKNANVSVISLSGTLVYKGSAGEINTESWDKGVYLVVVRDGKAIKTVKVIK